MAIGGPALGVTTEGLQWPLRGARLDPSTSLGMSNVMQGAIATVNVGEGRLLTIQPDPES